MLVPSSQLNFINLSSSSGCSNRPHVKCGRADLSAKGQDADSTVDANPHPKTQKRDMQNTSWCPEHGKYF